MIPFHSHCLLTNTLSRMKVIFAAHAASACITMCILPEEPDKIRKRVLPRVSQLQYVSVPLMFHPFCIDSKEYMDTTKPDSSDDDSDWESEDEPLTTSAITIGAQTRPISEAEWYVMSTNPDSMVGRSFSLSNESGSDEDMAYEISGHRFRKGQE
jgi:hypothetical protein